MRFIFTLALLLLGQLTVQAQCCPYLQPVQILPANPRPTDIVRLVFTATTPGQGNKINHQFVHFGDTLRFTGCYYSGMLAAPQTFRDTVTVGTMPNGNYIISFVGYVSYRNSQQCAADQRNSLTTRIRLANGVLSTRPAAADWEVYPMPATGRLLQLRSPGSEPVQAIRLLDVMGRECYVHPAADLAKTSEIHQLRLPALPAGTYTLQVKMNNGGIKTQRVILL